MSKPRKWTKVREFPHRLGLTIDDELLNHLDAVAGSLEISRAEVMRRVLRAGVDDLQKQEKPPFALDRSKAAENFKPKKEKGESQQDLEAGRSPR